jgi:electron transfer flavoprotein
MTATGPIPPRAAHHPLITRSPGPRVRSDRAADAPVASRIVEAPLPNLLVLIDLRDGVPTEPSLFALSEARRVAHDAGVTVFAVLMCDPRPEAEIGRVAARLGVAGADKILLFERAGLDAPPLDATHGALLHLAAERIPPLLVLFPAGGAGLQLGPPLAVRLGAAFAAAADLEVSDSPVPLVDSVGRLCLRRWRRDLSAYRRLDPVELERPVIAVLGAHGRSRDAGTPDVEIEVMETPPAGPARIVELESSVDEHAGIALASVLVVVGPTVGADVAAKLAASAPPDVAVVDLARVPPAALAVSTPRAILAVEAAANVAAPSPRTRLGLVLAPTTDAAALGRADVVWRAAAWDELVATLPRLSKRAQRDGEEP